MVEAVEESGSGWRKMDGFPVYNGNKSTKEHPRLEIRRRL